MSSLIIRTPEGIELSLPLAGPVTRFFAWAIDLAVIMAVLMIVSTLLAVFSALSPGLYQAAMTILFFGLQIGYAMACEWLWRGQTLGKRLLRLRVVDESGLRLAPSQVVIRNLLRFVDSLPLLYLVGGIACLISPRGQRLGDLAANTVVVRGLTPIQYDPDRLGANRFNSFHDYPHLEARLRHRVSPRESALALAAIARRDELDPQARVELMAELARHFKALVPFPEEATLGLTDEQYLRNVVDGIYSQRAK
jgi:uncharacterized RDD family membrane protein YckC